MVLLSLLVADAHAAFWDRPRHTNLAFGLSAILTFGSDDRARVGAGLDAGLQSMWHPGAWGYDGPRLSSPLVDVGLHVGWTHPVSFIEVTAGVGYVYPMSVSDAGFVPAIGGTVGGGLGFATDGGAGPVLVGGLLGPFSHARFEGAPTRDGWLPPQLAVGPMLAPNCCNYYL